MPTQIGLILKVEAVAKNKESELGIESAVIVLRRATGLVIFLLEAYSELICQPAMLKISHDSKRGLLGPGYDFCNYFLKLE